MTTINDKMGYKRAGRRAFMKNLPTTRAEAVKVTAAKCPDCGRTGASPSKTKGPEFLSCTWCAAVFERPA